MVKIINKVKIKGKGRVVSKVTTTQRLMIKPKKKKG